MFENNSGPKVAFQPPSDMTPEGGGGSSTGKKVFIGLGIGCGAILLVIGILFAAGAFKAVSCCNQFKGLAETSMGAEQFANTFATQVWEGELDAAYANTSESFQKEVSREAFGEAVEAHRERMQSNAPRMFNMNLEQSGSSEPSLEDLGKGTWRMSYQFAGPKDTTMLLLHFGVVHKGEGEDKTFKAVDVRFDERPRNLDLEPPAQEVNRVHDLIRESQYELAYARLGDAFRNDTDREAWQTFLREAGPILTASTLQVREVSYDSAGQQATVMTHAKTVDGKNAIIQWELQSMAAQLPGHGWRVVTIAPMVAETNTDGPADPVPPMPEGTNGATNGAAEGATGQGGTNAAAPPEVKVEGSD